MSRYFTITTSSGCSNSLNVNAIHKGGKWVIVPQPPWVLGVFGAEFDDLTIIGVVIVVNCYHH